MPWHPGPYEEAFLRAYSAGNIPEARRALEQALVRAPRALDLRMKEISLLAQHFPAEPRADRIRQALSLDRANARVALDLSLPDSDLPIPERIAALERALTLDRQLPPDEYKRLTPEQIALVQQKIAALRSATRPTATSPGG
jgi:hypothetical protein